MQTVQELNIVENWLGSLDLSLYTQSFLDNGYDDLEICKQVGDEDLDAIGVQDSEHRGVLLQAVDHLRQHGGSHVYFILDPEYQRLHGLQCSGCSSGNTPVHVPRDCPKSPPYPIPPDGYVGKPPSVPVKFTKLQLTAILQDKLAEDGVNLADYPAVNNQVMDDDVAETCLDSQLQQQYQQQQQQQQDHHHQQQQQEEGLRCLAERYASDLHTNSLDVFQCLTELHDVLTCQNGIDQSPMDDADSPTRTPYFMFSVYGQPTRSVPPPLPSCPPPTSDYEEMEALDPIHRTSPSHSSRSPLLPQQRSDCSESTVDLRPGRCEVSSAKKASTLSRLFRNKKQGRKYIYKQYEGDLNASEITMSEDDRIDLMIKVKEGKLSMHDAVEMVKQYEIQKKGGKLTKNGATADITCS